MRTPLTVILAVALSAALGACVQSGGGGGATGTPGGGHSGSPVVMKVNGQPITAQQLIESPEVRTGIRNMIFYQTMVSEFNKSGLKLDDKEVQDKIAESKKSVMMQGQVSWEEYLSQQSMNENEFKRTVEGQMMYEALLKTKMKITDDDLKKSWEENKEQVVNKYLTDHALPVNDSEKAKVTFEMAKDLVREREEGMQGMMLQSEFFSDIVETAQLQLLFKDKAEAELYQNLILYDQKESNKKAMEKIKSSEESDKTDQAAPAEGEGAAAEGAAGDASADEKSGEAPAEDSGNADSGASKEEMGGK